MARILFAWEIGSNLGHLTRLLPLAQRLKSHGHTVLVAARSLGPAAQFLGPHGISFLQSPHSTRIPKDRSPLVSYADLLLHHGWDDPTLLWGLVQGWSSMYGLFRPDIVVGDYAPTALLAARAGGLRCVVVGTGFEVPPDEAPLPPFPGITGATAQAAAQAESLVLANANHVLKSLQSPPLEALRDVFRVEQRWLTTFAELDHYGPRPGGLYIGPIGEPQIGERIDWPSVPGNRVFAYLRPNTPDCGVIMQALAQCGAAVIGYLPGAPPGEIELLRNCGVVICTRPVHLETLLATTNLCVSYSPAGTVTASLLRGVPQLLAPAHVESQLTARRIESMGAGSVLVGAQTTQTVAAALEDLLRGFRYKERAHAFARQYRHCDPREGADEICRGIEGLAS